MIYFAQIAVSSCLLLLTLIVSSSATTIRLALIMADEDSEYYMDSYEDTPAIFTLLKDEINADTWVDYPLYQVLEDFKASLAKDPGTPDP